jgi:hypothetical protein
VHPDSKLWYNRGYIDVYITDQYMLPFKIIDSRETGDWRLEQMLFSYELPPVPGIDGVWGDRTIRSFSVAESDQGVTVGTVQILTKEMHANMVEIFLTFFGAGISFDWETYPMIVTVRAAGVRPGSDKLIYTNELRFELVPLYGESIRDGARYTDGNWPTDEDIERDNPPVDWDEEKYERDKEIYDAMMISCDFSQTHLVGCLPGQDHGMIDCYTFIGADAQIEALYPEYKCCPKEEPDEPQAPLYIR